MAAYKLPLDDYCLESVVVPFYSSTMMDVFEITIESKAGCPASYRQDWCCGSILWDNKLAEGTEVIVNVKGDINISNNDRLIFRSNIMAGCGFFLEFFAGEKLVGKTQVTQGIGKPYEHIFAYGDIFDAVPEQLTAIRLHVLAPPADSGIMQLSWLGLRSEAYEQVTKGLDARRSTDWNPWLIPAEQRGPLRFLRGLLFSESDLEDVRRKAQSDGWRAHFAILEKDAELFISKNPEDRFDAYLPSPDARFSRTRFQNVTHYHWEALVVGFVGLVNNNQKYIDYALRYLMCMIHTVHWRYSGYERSASDPWNARAFLEEMTSTSVAILYDWFHYALRPQAKEQIHSVLWTRGLAFVRYDLLSQDYMHTMNQGIVFNRACILAGLVLEKNMPRVRPYVDLAYTEMLSIVEGRTNPDGSVVAGYIRPDGSVPEGVGYYCQMANGLIWSVIAWCRARGESWENVLKKLFKNTEDYAHAMTSITGPGKMIPYADCRLDDWVGDIVPVLAKLFPGSFFAGILRESLERGNVYKLTGTLTKSAGIIGMVHGPAEADAPLPKLPEITEMPQGGKVSVVYNKNDSLVHLWLSGSQADASHTHMDIGSFVFEFNGAAVFEDLGMVDYSFSKGDLLKSTYMHNCITPVVDAIFVDQDPPAGDSIPYARKSGDKITMSIDCSNAWGKYFSSYTRTITIDSEKYFLINDAVTCLREMPIAFHLHSLFEPKIENQKITLFFGETSLLIEAPWISSVEVKKDSMNVRQTDMYRISLLGKPGTTHDLNTKFVISGAS